MLLTALFAINISQSAVFINANYPGAIIDLNSVFLQQQHKVYSWKKAATKSTIFKSEQVPIIHKTLSKLKTNVVVVELLYSNLF